MPQLKIIFSLVLLNVDIEALASAVIDLTMNLDMSVNWRFCVHKD
jgi:hypothetical protein